MAEADTDHLWSTNNLQQVKEYMFDMLSHTLVEKTKAETKSETEITRSVKNVEEVKEDKETDCFCLSKNPVTEPLESSLRHDS